MNILYYRENRLGLSKGLGTLIDARFERRLRTPWKEILRRFVMKRDFGTQSPRGLDSRAESSDRRLHRSRERGEEPFPFVEPHPQHYCFDQL